MKILKLASFVASLLIIQSCSNTNLTSDEMKLFVLDCGMITVKDVSLFSPAIDKGKSKKLANTCYLIKHPKGHFLWETGLSDTLVKDSAGVTIAEGMFHLQVKSTLESQLADIGLTPIDIDYVALSHFHFDHTGNMNLFTQAKFLVQQDELDVAFSSKAREMHFDPSSYNKINKTQYAALSGDHDVFKDGSLMILSSPGHTPGHQSLMVNLKETGPVLLSGDLYHFEKNRKHRRVPALNFNKAITVGSMDNIENMVNNVNGQLWIQHDLATFNQLKQSPDYFK
jgi:glyoxylase-like metal-dependent hydrolase (beta-lactamase superfamily II)